MFLLDTVVGRVRVAFTDRHGGVSSGPWASLNLARRASGDGGGDGDGDGEEDNHDEPAMISANLTRLAEVFGVPVADVVGMRQVHGREVAVVDHESATGPPRTADALVTRSPGLVLLARAADCVPVALADPALGLAGVVHSGRPGTLAGVVPAAVDVLREMGAGDLRAWIGPRVCGACYEVPARMRAEVAAVEPATWSTTRAGTPGLDLAAGVREQLRRRGVAVHDLADVRNVCTMESDDLYSYRRQGVRSGRLAAVVQVQA